MAKELIRDLSKVVDKAIRDTFEDRYYMDFRCEGVEPTLVAESGSGDVVHTFANIYTSEMYSSGARPSNKKARNYMDNSVEAFEDNIDELVEGGEDEDTALSIALENSTQYEPYVLVEASPRYFTNKDGFQICDLTISMNLVSYNGSKVVKYEPKLISFSTVTMNDRINNNYVSEDDFEFEHGGFPVDDESIIAFIQNSIEEYLGEF